MDLVKEWWGLLITAVGALLAALYAQVIYRMARQDKSVEKLFEKLEEHKDNDNEKFAEITSIINTHHLELLEELRRTGAGRR